MGFGAKGSKESTKQSEFTTQNTNQTQTGTRKALFDSPQAQQILGALTGQVSGSGAPDYGAEAGGMYRNLASTPGGVNPFVEQAITASNKEGDVALQTGLAGVRAGAFRGGTGASMYGQGRMVADAANTRAKDNALARIGAFDAGESRRMAGVGAGASGLAGMGNSQQLLAAQILALLRGEDINQNTVGTGTSKTDGSGTRSNVSAGFSILKGQ